LKRLNKKVVRMASKITTSRMKRAQQWLLFARQWHVIDANQQDAWNLGKEIALRLCGKHKPIYHQEVDCGDNVVVVNTRHVSLHGFDWKHLHFYYNREYPKSKNELPAYQIHEYDPCRVLWTLTGRQLVEVTRNGLVKRRCLERLHLFPDNEMPNFIKKNINNQLAAIQVVPKKSTEYTKEERVNFPRLFKFPDNHVLDWHDNAEPPESYPDREELERKK